MATEAPVSRRERVRASTVDEIKAVAHRLLVEEGPEAVTLRAIAREMGMTAPGLYRYFPSHEDLRIALVADSYDRLAATLVQARDGAPAAREADPRLHAKPLVGVELLMTAKAFRAWCAANPREFALVFGTPVPALAEQTDNPAFQAGMRFGAVFVEIFARLWAEHPFPVEPDDALPASLTSQLASYRETLISVLGEPARALPLGAINVFMRAWTQLYGLAAMEIFNHLHFCLTDVEPFFETTLASLGREMGIEYTPSV